jgi:hypothetical protein
VVVFREIFPQYSVPLGVWVVRETARDAMRQRGETFATRQKALAYIDSRLRAREGRSLQLQEYEALSRILRQKRLSEF